MLLTPPDTRVCAYAGYPPGHPPNTNSPAARHSTSPTDPKTNAPSTPTPSAASSSTDNQHEENGKIVWADARSDPRGLRLHGGRITGRFDLDYPNCGRQRSPHRQPTLTTVPTSDSWSVTVFDVDLAEPVTQAGFSEFVACAVES